MPSLPLMNFGCLMRRKGTNRPNWHPPPLSIIDFSLTDSLYFIFFDVVLLRFELALYTLLAKGAISEEEERSNSIIKGKTVIGSSSSEQLIESELLHLQIHDNLGSHKPAQSNRINLSDCMAEFQSGVPFSNVLLV